MLVYGLINPNIRAPTPELEPKTENENLEAEKNGMRMRAVLAARRFLRYFLAKIVSFLRISSRQANTFT